MYIIRFLILYRWLKKKMTEIDVVQVELRSKIVEGLMVSDKVGEVKFIRLDKLESEGIK